MAQNWSLRDQLQALAAFRPVFERKGFTFAVRVPGLTEDGLVALNGGVLTQVAQHFYKVVHDYGWVRPLDGSV